MGKISGIAHEGAVRALEMAGFNVVRPGKHIVVSNGLRVLPIPRANPINAYTMAGIVRDAAITEEDSRKLL